MARIPDVVERTIPNATGNVVPMRPDNYSEVQGIAQDIADVNTASERLAEHRRAAQAEFDMANAESQFLQSHITTLNALQEGNPDKPAEWVPTYQKSMTEARKNASALIQDPLARQQFMQKADVQMIRGTQQAHEGAISREREIGLGRLYENLDANRNGAMLAGNEGDKVSFIVSSQRLISAGMNNGWLTPKEANDLSRKTGEDYAVASFKLLPPGVQISALTGKVPKGQDVPQTTLDYIPLDQRKILLEQAKAQQVANQNAADKAQQDLIEKGMVTAKNIILSTKSIDGVDPAFIRQLSPSQHTALLNYTKTLADPVTDLQTYYDFKKMPEEQFKQANLMDSVDKLSNNDMQHLMDLQAGLRNDDVKARQEMGQFQTESQIVTQTLATFGIDANSKDEDTAKAVSRFTKQFDEALFQKREMVGRKNLAPEEMQQVIGDVIKQIHIPGRRFVPAFLEGYTGPLDKPAFQFTIDDVPDDDAEKIRDSLSRHGLPADDQSIVDAYIKKLQSAPK